MHTHTHTHTHTHPHHTRVNTYTHQRLSFLVSGSCGFYMELYVTPSSPCLFNTIYTHAHTYTHRLSYMLLKNYGSRIGLHTLFISLIALLCVCVFLLCVALWDFVFVMYSFSLLGLTMMIKKMKRTTRKKYLH